jgi:hypothetical protein
MSKLPPSGEYVAFSCGKLAAPIVESQGSSVLDPRV